MRKLWRRITFTLLGESGVAGVIIAAVIAVIGFTALSIYLSKFAGNRSLAQAQASASGGGRIIPAVFAYFYQQSTHTLPCPDTSATPDGVADTCNGSGTTSGVIPWVTLGLTQDDAIDSHGNYFTFIVSATAKNLCTSIGNDYSGAAAAEVTGSLITASDLTLMTTTGNRSVAFAIIGHGKNGLGAMQKNGTLKSDPTSAHELANKHGTTPSTIYADAYSEDSSNYFDDAVSAPSNNDLEAVCKSLTPGGALNADLAENFESPGTTLPTSLTTTGSGTAPTKTTVNNNKVVQFTAVTSYLYTAASYYLSPVTKPRYVSARWTPDSAATTAGISIATRGNQADLSANSDIFGANNKAGFTFRFYDRGANNSSAAGVQNHLHICDDTKSTCDNTAGNNLALSSTGGPNSNGTFNLISGQDYDIEAFDDGTNLWMRITQVDNSANSVSVRTTTAPSTDTSGTQSVFFINNTFAASIMYLDDVFIGLPMLALETDGINDYASSAAGTNGFTGAAPHNLTLEAWIKVRSAPTGNVAIVSKWDSSSAVAGNQAYRLYLDSSRALHFDISGAIGGTASTETYSLGITPNLMEWTHVAVVYDAANQTVRGFENGTIASQATSHIDTATGANDTNAQPFSVGAEFNGATPVDIFPGDISEVRVWEAARSTSNMLDCYETRLPTTTCPSTNLIVNWRLDPGVNGLSSATTAAIAGTAGTLTNGAQYVPTQAVFFRPFSTSFCPSGTRVGAYECDFRASVASGVSQSFTIPGNLAAVYAKVWGAGGGGYDSTNTSAAGSGGFAAGLIQSINGTSVGGMTVNLYVGGYGTGSSTTNNGGGGGAGSGIFTALGVAGLVAGGGGGASYSNANVSGAGDCGTVSGTSTQCGLGGQGGGIGFSAQTSRAADQSSNCGGRGGNNVPSGNSPPIAGGDCPAGGGDPSGHVGGGTGAGGAGGSPATVGGGPGYVGSSASRVGGGGGGGGNIGGEAGGYNDGANTAGYGGGGGSGTADAGVINTQTAVGSFTVTSDSSHTGDISNSSSTITNISGTFPTTWSVGFSISGTGVPNGSTITALDSAAHTVTFGPGNGNGNHTGSTLTVSGMTSTPGGSTDVYYSPSYLTSTLQNPGTGGTTGTSVNGHVGAIVLIW